MRMSMIPVSHRTGALDDQIERCNIAAANFNSRPTPKAYATYEDTRNNLNQALALVMFLEVGAGPVDLWLANIR